MVRKDLENVSCSIHAHQYKLTDPCRYGMEDRFLHSAFMDKMVDGDVEIITYSLMVCLNASPFTILTAVIVVGSGGLPIVRD